MFGLVFVSAGQNEGLIIIALTPAAQLALLLCGTVSACYTCTQLRNSYAACRNGGQRRGGSVCHKQ